MALTKNIFAYEDIRDTLHLLEGKDGIRVSFETPKAANYWRMRANYYRKLLADQEIATYASIPGYNPNIPFSDLILKIDGSDIVITRRLPPQVTDLSGNIVEVPEETETNGNLDKLSTQVKDELL